MREEYPRMNWRRKKFQILNGRWNFKFDEKNVGHLEKWHHKFPIDAISIEVPFAYQTKLSGIDDQRRCDVVWYNKSVEIDAGYCEINFGAIDYESDIYIDGQHYMHHIGGETHFKIDYYSEVKKSVNLTIRVVDPSYDESIPRGKQVWEDESHGIWYTPTTGIWQSVWIDYVGQQKVTSIRTKSNLDEGTQEFKIRFNTKLNGKKVNLQVFNGKDEMYNITQAVNENFTDFKINMYNEKIFNTSFHGYNRESICWTPENPKLFDYKVTILNDNQEIDSLDSYFGFREIRIENGKTILNNNPYYFKLILDQGYWEEGLLTAPSDKDFIKDIELAKEMGFNGCRKHQKVEDPRFLYWADRLGFLVWGEVSSCPSYNEKAVKASQHQWFEIIERDYNNPSIVAWVPLNESWGVPFIRFNKQQQSHSLSLYHQIKSLDDTRLVLSNDGWEQTKTDICAIHNYNHGAMNDMKSQQYFKHIFSSKEVLLNSRAAGKPIYADGFSHESNVPIVLTEFGGIAFDFTTPKGWGYTSVDSAEKLIAEYKRIIEVFSTSDSIFGYCYTQLCDVEQEVNGFLTYDREPKCDLSEIKKINDSLFVNY